ncbi:unnamed protein product [Brassica rapa subsp. trilocularis]
MAESRTFLLCYPPRTIHHRSFFHFSLRSITQMKLFLFDSLFSELYVNIGYRKHGLQDPDSVLGSLTREIKEVGPDGQEDQGIEILTEAIAACTETIDQHKGKLVVKEAPRAVKHMAKLRMDNEEISGNEEEEEDTGMGEVDIEGAGIVE